MRAVHKRYLREFLPAMGAYAVVVIVCSWLLLLTENPWARIALGLLPMLPILLAIRAMVRVVRDQDELERRIDLEAFAIAAMVTGFGFFSFGLLLQAGIGWPVRPGMVAIMVMPALFASYGVAKVLVIRRYGKQ